MADIEKELAELRNSQEQGKTAMENSVVEASLYLQDQVRALRVGCREQADPVPLRDQPP